MHTMVISSKRSQSTNERDIYLAEEISSVFKYVH